LIQDLVCLGQLHLSGTQSLFRLGQLLGCPFQSLLDGFSEALDIEFHAGIQKADQEAWPKFTEAGTVVTRLSQDDVDAFTKLAVPLWYNWANKDKDAARVFKIQLDYMMSGSLGYVTPDMIKGQKLKWT